MRLARLGSKPKSKAGKRRVPIVRKLRVHLVAHSLRAGRPNEGYVLPGRDLGPCTSNAVRRRAKRAWAAGCTLKEIADQRRAVTPLGQA